MISSSDLLPPTVAMKYDPPQLPAEPSPIVLANILRFYSIATTHPFSSERVARELAELARHLPGESIPDSDGSVYLRRFLVAQMDDESRVYLHEICRADEDMEHHSHPRRYGQAAILAYGYTEERLAADPDSPLGFKVVTNVLRPGMMNTIDCDDFHRISKINGPSSWSVMFVSEKAVRPEGEDSWSFKNPITGEVTGYKAFLEVKDARARALQSEAAYAQQLDRACRGCSQELLQPSGNRAGHTCEDPPSALD